MSEVIKIVSRENKKLKNLRQIREGKIRDLIFIEGVRSAEETLRSDLKITEIFISEIFQRSDRGRLLCAELTKTSRQVYELTEQTFQSIADTKQSQGIVVVAERPATTLENFERRMNITNRTDKLFIFLNQINNPSNLGAILRTAEAAGVSGLIVSENSADVFSPKTIRAALGANLRLPIWGNANIEKVLHWSKEMRLITTGADVNARLNYSEIDWTVPRLLIFGSEANGLSAEERAKISELIYIPMENNVESLNIAVSCGIILFEAKRQNSL